MPKAAIMAVGSVFLVFEFRRRKKSDVHAGEQGAEFITVPVGSERGKPASRMATGILVSTALPFRAGALAG